MIDVKATKLDIRFACLLMLTVLSVLALSVSGCDRRSRHKVLTFFFTGVPPLEENKKPAKESEKETGVIVEGQQIPVKPVLYSHAPWASGYCEQCHQGAKGFGTPGQKHVTAVFRKGGGIPGKLVKPLGELCIICHKDKSYTKAAAEGLWLHTILAESDCSACHDPHQSQNPNMLLEKRTAICSGCHLDGDIKVIADSCIPDKCLDCHNPHMGKDRFLLKKDYRELKQKPLTQF